MVEIYFLLIDSSQVVTKSIDISMYSSLMGNFNTVTPISYIRSTLDISISSIPIFQVHHFQMMYFEDPWILTCPYYLVEGIKHVEMENTLSTTKISYQAIQRYTADPYQNPFQMEVDDLLTSIWVFNSSHSPYCLKMVLPSYEAII
jgi:hypothetical protein